MKEKKIPLKGNDMLPAETTRQARVDTIKQAVEAGTYRFDNRALADSLISDLLWQQFESIKLFKIKSS